ncbi:hypothetical protein Q2T42_26270 [Leptolyngbya boryana CZ1]|uniref:Uncharacterized protein n=1 Tax=Leptolyngbya boryana CZ1 TaxID=3060204 RepID=A0AA96WW28_LEPBY|nr:MULTISPECIES: hypothetical protein [Leptolyngbya]MBD1856566.1 hypothetical protein [Leptolyngbya sp. FACHB-1624]MBN8565079.1 hypothetical protein [Leptolyngbya sp. UWPOB_LEPTO1]WNZ45299.1 hypothetical protein Q2T42_26270 [Leptolyngbya boryana CZ1]
MRKFLPIFILLAGGLTSVAPVIAVDYDRGVGLREYPSTHTTGGWGQGQGTYSNRLESPYGRWTCQSYCFITEWYYPDGVKPGSVGYPSRVRDSFGGDVKVEEPSAPVRLEEPVRQFTDKKQ